ncbi:cytochrome P450 [Xylariomycetidae sp. FL2044]|nr:cytochrome P450 [Xylariomycetidae sp. FL2044]
MLDPRSMATFMYDGETWGEALLRMIYLPTILMAFGTLLLFGWIIVAYARVLRQRRKLPPGPFPLPIFGNYFQVPTYKPWVTWEQMSKKYDNPMITIWNGHRPVIMCHDAWTISDLLEKRAPIYSSRPRLYASGDLVESTEWNQICLVYGDQWRRHRKLMHTVVGSQAIRAHGRFQGPESKILTLDLLKTPEEFVTCIERYSCSVVSIVGYGRLALAIMKGVDYVIPCWSLVETVPWTMKLPRWIYAFPSEAREAVTAGRHYFTALAREAIGREENFSKYLFEGQEEHGICEREVSSLTANLIGGGVDTTSGSIISFILAMCVFPEVQRKAQEEMDRVVGQGRSPTWDDQASLPYAAACATEVLRWRTVTTLGGIPHAPIRDDIYRGYHIPAGTAITGNVWAIHRHPREFPAPDSFRPERFLNGLERPYPSKKGHNAFGWGRRTCSGQPLAEQSLLSVIIRLLWAYDIRPGLDESGNEVTLDIFAYTSCENMRPEPFKARFIPRTPQIEQMILEEAKVAREELRIYDGDTKISL